MQSEYKISGLIDQIYDAALAPEKWGGVVEGIGRQIGQPLHPTEGTSGGRSYSIDKLTILKIPPKKYLFVARRPNPPGTVDGI